MFNYDEFKSIFRFNINFQQNEIGKIIECRDYTVNDNLEAMIRLILI